MTHFQPIESQDELDRIIQSRVKRLEKALAAEREVSRTWESRTKSANAQRDAYRRDAEVWRDRARENLAVIRAHEKTIAKFIDKLDDVLSEED